MDTPFVDTPFGPARNQHFGVIFPWQMRMAKVDMLGTGEEWVFSTGGL